MFDRHDRIWLNKAGWEAARAQLPAHAGVFAQWEKNDWPVIVRRNEGTQQAGTLCLGLPLPPDETGNKLRIGFIVNVADIARHAMPLAIDEARSTLPSQWQKPLTDFSEAAARAQLAFHVYGSAAMQSMTKLSYLTTSSDIDLLLYPRARSHLQQGLQLLQVHAKHLPLDGEIVFPSGRAVAWKEWAAASARPETMRILAKSMQAVNLTACASLLAELE
jgi:phosphoribosyl-dephospho-CoA transferase